MVKLFFDLKFCRLIFWLVLTLESIAQSGDKPFSLPPITEYVIRNWHNVTLLGPQLPFEEQKAIVFGDIIKIENLQLFHQYNKTVHLIVVANRIQIGSNNHIDLSSDQNNKAGGSIILLCRELFIERGALLEFKGATNFPVKTFNTKENYDGGFGSQLLIATEELRLAPGASVDIKTSLLQSASQFLSQFLDNSDARFYEGANSFIDSDMFRSRLNDLIKEYKRFFTNEDYSRLVKLFDYEPYTYRRVSKDLIEKAIALLDMDLQSSLNMNQFNYLFYFTKYQRDTYNATKPAPISPFRKVYPDFGYGINRKWYSFYNFPIHNSAVPIVIDASSSMWSTVNSLMRFRRHPHSPGPDLPDEDVFPAGQETIGFINSPEALQTLSKDHHQLFSQWLVAWIRYKKTQAEQARGLENRAKYFTILREVAEMPRYQLDDPYEDQYNEINTQMLAKLNEAKNVVSEKQLVLDAPLTGKPVSVFAQGIPYMYYLPPTEVLINGLHANNNWYYGILQNINAEERLTRLTLQGELKSDPLISAGVRSELQSSEQSALQPGLLPGIQYQINGSIGEGIKKFIATVSGSVVTFALDIDPEQIGSVMFRLATTGLPYYLKWTLPGDPVQIGQLEQPLFLRLSRRTGGRVHVIGMQLANEESTGLAIVRYVQTSTGRILSINEEKVEAGKTVTLTGLDLEAGERLVYVPDMGITYDDGGFDKAVTRFLVDAGQVIDHIIVSNKIPAGLSPTGSGLTYQVRNVEVNIALVNTGTNATQPFAHLQLSPEGSDGAVRPAVQVPRPAAMSNIYRVTGKVNFTDGSSAPLKPKDVASPLIDIAVDDAELPGG